MATYMYVNPASAPNQGASLRYTQGGKEGPTSR